MLRECFTNPIIFAVVGADQDNKVVSGSIVGVKEVGDHFEETEAPGEDDEEVFGPEEVVEILLVLLDWLSDIEVEVETWQNSPKAARASRAVECSPLA